MGNVTYDKFLVISSYHNHKDIKIQKEHSSGRFEIKKRSMWLAWFTRVMLCLGSIECDIAVQMCCVLKRLGYLASNAYVKYAS